MKSFSKRLVAAVVSVLIPALDVGLGGLIPETAAVTPIKAAAAESQKGEEIFENRDATTVTSSMSSSDPYGTGGSKWANLVTVPEVYGFKNGYSLVDDPNGDYDKSDTTCNNYEQKLYDSTGLNIGNGRDDKVAVVCYDSMYGLALWMSDPQKGGVLTDDNFSETAVTKPLIPFNPTTTKTTDLFRLRRMGSYSNFVNIGSDVSYLDDNSVEQKNAGQYLSIAAGDFNGDGKDTIVTYVPDYTTPCIQEYSYSKSSASEFDGASLDMSESISGRTTLSHTGSYYKPSFSKNVSSNVYTDFGLSKISASNASDKSRNVPIVDIVAADVDKDGRDELIVTAGLGDTTSSNSSTTKVKIYDLVNGSFQCTFTQELTGTYYAGKNERLRWASAAVGNVDVNLNVKLGVDFPEIVVAGWVDAKSGSGIDMKHRYGVHVISLQDLDKDNHDNLTGTARYTCQSVYGTSDKSIGSSSNKNGVSENMRDGFHADDGVTSDWNRRDKLGVGVVAARGPAQNAYVVLGDTVYSIGEHTEEGYTDLYAEYNRSSISSNNHYSVRKVLTGNFNGKATEGVYLLLADESNKYYTYRYEFIENSSSVVKDKDTKLDHLERTGYWTQSAGSFNVSSSTGSAADICNIDVDDDGLAIKLKSVTKKWCEPKPIAILEAPPYFDELNYDKNGSIGCTSISFSNSKGSTTSYSAGINASIQAGFKQNITFFLEFAKLDIYTQTDFSLTYSGATSTDVSITKTYKTEKGKNSVIVGRVPYYVYEYETRGVKNNNAAYTVITYGQPETTGISENDYNDMVDEYNNGKDPKDWLNKIDTETLKLATPGDPYSYRTAFPTDAESNVIKKSLEQPASGLCNFHSNTSSEEALQSSTSTENGFNVELGQSVTAEIGIAGFHTSIGAGVTASTGYCAINSNSVTRSGCAGNYYSMNSANKMDTSDPANYYDFSWDFGFWGIKSGSGDKADNIPVLGYIVNKIDSPTVAPESLMIVDNSNDGEQATFKWTMPECPKNRRSVDHLVLKFANSNDKVIHTKELYFHRTGEADDKNKSYVDDYDPKNGSCSYTLNYADEEGLNSNTTYKCSMSAITYYGSTETPDGPVETIDSNTVELATGNVKRVTVIAGKGLELASGSGEATQRVNNDAIKNITFNVKNGYTIPEDLKRTSYSVNNILVTINTNNIILSGKPTEKITTITLPDMVMQTYSITYSLDGGKLNDPVKSYTITPEEITLPTPVKEGSIFTGWKDENGKIIFNLAADTTGDKTLTATWLNIEKLGYTESYHADGSEEYPYVISDSEGWDFFCDCLKNSSFDKFAGKTIALSNDITTDRMLGNNSLPFEGTFDGQGHTLTFSGTASDNYVAPFAYLNGTKDSHAAIKNLNVKTKITDEGYRHIAGLVAVHTGYVDITNCNADVELSASVGGQNPSDLYPAGLVSQSNGTLNISGCKVNGTISTNGKYAAGLVSIIQGSAKIENNASSVTIKSSLKGDGTHGGLIAASNDATIEGCIFNGKLLTNNGTINCAGFVGWRNGTVKIINSIYAPAAIENGETEIVNTTDSYPSATFIRNGAAATINNCYYTRTLGTAQGKQAYTITADENVTIDYGTPLNTYDVSGINSYGSGLSFNGKFYAGNGENVALTLNSNAPAGKIVSTYTFNAGTYDNGVFTMPAENVTVGAELADCEYTLVPANEPTETENGNSEYYIGSDGRFYVLADGVYTEVEKDSWVIAATGYSNPTISFIPGNGRVKLTWTAVPNAEKYAVYGYISGDWKGIAQCDTTSMILNNLKAGTNYRVVVLAKVNGKWNYDVSNAIVVTPVKLSETTYPKATVQVKGSQFKLTWTAADNAEKYSVAVNIGGKWRVIKNNIPNNEFSYISPATKTPAGTYKVAVAAYVNGKWDLTDILDRAVTVTIE